MVTAHIARVAYDARKSFALVNGQTEPDWFKLEPWQRTAFLSQIRNIILNRGFSAEVMQEVYVADRAELGWTYGPRLDVRLKRDPFLLPWSKLSQFQRRSEQLVVAVVEAFREQHA